MLMAAGVEVPSSVRVYARQLHMPTSSGGFPSALHTRGTPSPANGQHVNLCISMMEKAYLLDRGFPWMTFVEFTGAFLWCHIRCQR